MKTKNRIAFVAFVSFLLLPVFSQMLASAEVQNVNEMIVATIEGGRPETVDPAWCYDTASAELIQNVYETLIFFDREKIDQFVPVLATSWDVSSDGFTYIFKIRGTDGTEPPVKFHNGDTLTTEDVEYSFERLLVQDRDGGPVWMFYEALLDCHSSRDEEGSIVVTAEQIDNAITRNATHVTFHLAIPYPPFLQILSAGWACIVNKDWCAELGDWPGTWDNWAYYNKPEISPIDTQNMDAPGPHVDAMCGTGPYYFEYRDGNLKEWSIHKFDDYWRGWPAPEANDFVERAKVTWHYTWEDRRDMFLAGEIDSVHVPRQNIAEVLDQPGVRCIYPLPDLICFAMFFTFDIDTASPYMGVPGGLAPSMLDESGIPPDFFSDIDVRKGFAYSFNYTKLIDEAFLGEASQPATPIIWGLPFHNPAQEKYSLNLTKAEEHFRAAWNGQLWDTGFNVTICYNLGNLARQKACEIIKPNVESLNPGKFHINIAGIPWGTEYLPQMVRGQMPIFIIGWLADFSDPHNFAYPFMHSSGAFAHWQRYANATVDAPVEAGIRELNVTERKQIYYDLQSVYHEECPSVPIYQTRGRRFERDWVQGWYYNPVVYGNVFYTQWKEIVSSEVSAGNNTVDAVEASDTMILINATASGNVTISKHDINIEGPIPEDIVYMKCVIVDTTLSPDEIDWPIEIRIYYTDEEIISAYVEQSTLRMYYWNETSQEWMLEPDSGWVTPSDVPGYTGYVWAKIYHLSLFTAMGKRNAAPTVNPIAAPVDPVEVGTSITASAVFTDYLLDTHTAVWDWGDDSTSPGVVDETGGCGTVSGSHEYVTPGVYTAKLNVTDDDGNAGTVKFEYLVVYDPEGGFVTGGGWIHSPEGAYTIDPTLTGKATFGFVSKYKKGASTPSGQTEFVFHVAGTKFHSTSYQWLVVAGPKAQFKGYGTINGEGDYGFMLTAVDGQLNGGGGVDKFRIKIWDKATGTIIYDNQLGDADDADATTAIMGGSIVIHKQK